MDRSPLSMILAAPRRRVLIGAVVHQRPTLAAWMRHLRNLDLSGLEVGWAFVCDGEKPRGIVWPEGAQCEVYPPGPQWTRHEGRDSPCFARLAAMRQQLAAICCEGAYDALFSVDSDVIVGRDTLQRLVETGQPWVAALVRNRPPGLDDGVCWNVMSVNVRDGRPFARHFRALWKGIDGQVRPAGPVVTADPRDLREPALPLMVGAVCLYSAELLRAARWRLHPALTGEDLGFAVEAIKAGFSGAYIPLECEHLMTTEQLSAHLRSCELCCEQTR